MTAFACRTAVDFTIVIDRHGESEPSPSVLRLPLMMVFQVTAKDPRGITRTFVREATDAASLGAALRAERWLVLAVEPRQAPRARRRGGLSALLPMRGFDVEMGVRQLASMLKSGVTLLEALGTVGEQAMRPRVTAAWLRVRDRVFAGSSFAAALAVEGNRFGEITVRLAEVGESSGELEKALARAADQLESRRSLRTQLVNALVYPLIAVAMAVAVSVYLVAVVIPKIGEFLSSGGAQLPPVTQALLDVSAWLNAYGMMIGAGLAAAVAVWTAVRFWPPGREAEDAGLLRIPVTGRLLRLSGTALFARAMQIMVESGVTLLDALSTGAGLMGNRRFRRRVADVREAVVRGSTLEQALAPAVEFMPMLRSMAAVGEKTGSLPEAFGETARFHEMLLGVAVRRFGMLIEPVMIAVTGGIVGFVYVAFFMALFAIAGTK